MSWFVDYLHFSLALLAISGPQSAIPVFLSLTTGMGKKEKAGVARTAMVTVALVLIISAVCGAQILKIFGTSLDSFRIAGGILLMTIAFSMLKAQETRHTEEETAEAANKDSIGTVPLGLPILAGPGSISAVVIATQTNPTPAYFAVVVCSILTVAGVAWMCLRMADRIGAFLGQTGINIMSRIFGMLVAAVAVQFIYNSLISMFPAWVK